MQRLEVSGAVRPIYGSLGVKRLNIQEFIRDMVISVHCASWTFTNGEEELII